MENFQVPANFKIELAKIKEQIETNKSQFEKCQTLIQQLINHSHELQGKLDGTIKSIALVANFDTEKPLQITEDFDSLSGTPFEEPVPEK